eukprot:364501-Chlamydomonas_euryale.AAC.4
MQSLQHRVWVGCSRQHRVWVGCSGLTLDNAAIRASCRLPLVLDVPLTGRLRCSPLERVAAMLTGPLTGRLRCSPLERVAAMLSASGDDAVMLPCRHAEHAEEYGLLAPMPGRGVVLARLCWRGGGVGCKACGFGSVPATAVTQTCHPSSRPPWSFSHIDVSIHFGPCPGVCDADRVVAIAAGTQPVSLMHHTCNLHTLCAPRHQPTRGGVCWLHWRQWVFAGHGLLTFPLWRRPARCLVPLSCCAQHRQTLRGSAHNRPRIVESQCGYRPSANGHACSTIPRCVETLRNATRAGLGSSHSRVLRANHCPGVQAIQCACRFLNAQGLPSHKGHAPPSHGAFYCPINHECAQAFLSLCVRSVLGKPYSLRSLSLSFSFSCCLSLPLPHHGRRAWQGGGTATTGPGRQPAKPYREIEKDREGDAQMSPAAVGSLAAVGRLQLSAAATAPLCCGCPRAISVQGPGPTPVGSIGAMLWKYGLRSLRGNPRGVANVKASAGMLAAAVGDRRLLGNLPCRSAVAVGGCPSALAQGRRVLRHGGGG